METYTRTEQIRHQVRGIVGHSFDLYAIARQALANPRSYTKYRIIQAASRRTKATTFIETGTFFGVTTARCAAIFRQVYTIELDADLARRAITYLSPLKNVRVIQGDALHILPSLLENQSADNTLIFLDGHFMGGALGEMAEPAVEILPLIAPYRSKIKALIVDDFRTFGSGPGYPRKSELIASAEQNFVDHGYCLSILLDQLIIEHQP
jgi:hypothetical protein